MKRLLLLVVLLLSLSSCEPNIFKPTLNQGLDTVYQNDLWIDEGANLVIGFRKIPMQATNTIKTDVLGTFSVIYEVEHEDIVYKIQRNIQVISKQGLIAQLKPGIDTISVGETWIDAGLLSQTLINYTVVGVVDTSKVGTYKIEYIVSYQGNTYSFIRYVSVV
jgi:hypothetical protein